MVAANEYQLGRLGFARHVAHILVEEGRQQDQSDTDQQHRRLVARYTVWYMAEHHRDDLPFALSPCFPPFFFDASLGFPRG